MLHKEEKIDNYRRNHLAWAEFMDAWRIIPRVLVAGYCWILYMVIAWYMTMEPYLLEGCDVEKLGEACLVQAPATQHAALVTAVVGIAAAIFGLYASSGRKWDKGFIPWGKKAQPKPEEKPEELEMLD